MTKKRSAGSLTSKPTGGNGFAQEMGDLIEKSYEAHASKDGFPKRLTMREYMELVKEKREIAQFAPSRIYNMILSHGTETIPEKEQWDNASRRYKFFSDQLFGQEEVHEQIMEFLAAGAKRTETGKRILLLMGPPAGGKSTIAAIAKKGLENYSIPLYGLAGCELHEEPLHLIPRHLRGEFEQLLGVKIEGDLCPQCRHGLLADFADRDEYGEITRVRWDEFPVERLSLSERARIGIATFQPSDPKSQDISDLVGYEEIALSARYGKKDPRSYSLTGELEKANRGMIEFIEMLKCDKKFLWTLISVAQEQVIKVQGSTFPHIYIDTVILSHTNQPEYEEFCQEKEPALHDRIYVIKVPYPLRVSDEKKVYEKLIRSSEFKDIHIAPYALDITAMFTVLTRLVKSEMCEDMIKKMRYYNLEKVVDDENKNPVDIRKMREEGQKKGEGMFGISSRYAIDAINTALIAEGKTCLTPRTALKALKSHFEHHMGYSPEEIGQWQTLLSETEGGTVLGEYREIVLKEINKAFLKAYDDLAREKFDKYLRNITAYCRKEKIKDPITDERKDPDEKFMRSIEESIGISENAKSQFRQEVLVYKATEPEFNYDTYEPLREAVEKSLLNQVKDTLSLVVSKERPKGDEEKARARDLYDTLIQRGFCPVCAQEFLDDADRLLND